MKGVVMIVGIVLLAMIVGAAVAFRLYWRHNTHWFDKYEKALKMAGAEEKQVTLPNGNVINYGEVSNEKPALLLIHGQMSIWKDYALVLPELNKIGISTRLTSTAMENQHMMKVCIILM